MTRRDEFEALTFEEYVEMVETMEAATRTIRMLTARAPRHIAFVKEFDAQRRRAPTH